MIAIVSGRPSTPARTTDCGVPPTAIHTGIGSWTGRGHTPWSCERRAVAALPRDALARPQLQQQVELLGEQLVVVVEVVAEQRERLGERPAAGHDLGPAAGDQVDGGELLEHAHGIVRAQHA